MVTKERSLPLFNPFYFLTNHLLRLYVRLRFRQADHFLTVLPLAAFLQKLDALEALEDVALGCNCAGAF